MDQTLCIILSAALIVLHIWNIKIGWRLYNACCVLRTWFRTSSVKPEQPVSTPIPVLTTPQHLVDFDFDELYRIHTHVQALRLEKDGNTNNTNDVVKSSELAKLDENMLLKIHKIAFNYDQDHLRAAYIVEHDICTKSYTDFGLLAKIDNALENADHKTIHALWSCLKLSTIRYFIAMMVIVEEKENSFAKTGKPSTKRATIDSMFKNTPTDRLVAISKNLDMHIDKPTLDAARQVYIHGVPTDALILMRTQKKSDMWYREWVLGTISNLPQKYIDTMLLQAHNAQRTTSITGTGYKKAKNPNATNAANAEKTKKTSTRYGESAKILQTLLASQASKTRIFIEKDVYTMASDTPSGLPLSIY